MEEKIIDGVLHQRECSTVQWVAASKVLPHVHARGAVLFDRHYGTRADELEKELAVLEAEFNTTKSRYLQAIQALRGK